MATGKDHRGGKQYINMYPILRKWIHQCLLYQSEGYSPAMPDILGVSPFGPSNIRAMFPQLVLDEEGICERCRSAQTNLKN